MTWKHQINESIKQLVLTTSWVDETWSSFPCSRETAASSSLEETICSTCWSVELPNDPGSEPFSSWPPDGEGVGFWASGGVPVGSASASPPPLTGFPQPVMSRSTCVTARTSDKFLQVTNRIQETRHANRTGRAKWWTMDTKMKTFLVSSVCILAFMEACDFFQKTPSARHFKSRADPRDHFEAGLWIKENCIIGDFFSDDLLNSISNTDKDEFLEIWNNDDLAGQRLMNAWRI